MKQRFSIDFRCSPKHERDLILAICDVVDKFSERNPYDGNNVACVKICDPLKKEI